ncbi:NADH-quinone oxidoreductase subunit J [Aliikangiella sp. G2MR2-5]|uniref:NADH-quinone oxidoreductase subunit J n=1 Tax=Aliikangiella sp. G2MR2-5 TaxID=2788943 RepID=UPI0018AB26A5|nr:NADH-quinone oxidoreductase subunit J [Aliikangiella sp. G2MR2-5]
MTFQAIVFYSFAAWLIFAAIMVISSKNSVKAALFLVLTFASASAIWLLLEAEFLAISLIVVYVGAVMVLLLFVVMMLDVDYAALRQGFVKKLPIALIIAIAFFVVLYSFLTHGEFSAEKFAEPAAKAADYSNIKALGRVIYTEYFIAFEIAAVILLVAIIAAISLTFRGRRNRKSQNISKQLAANKKNRLKIVKVDPVVSANETSDELAVNQSEKQS